MVRYMRLAGLTKEVSKSGAVRWRVRVEGQPNRKIRIPYGPDDPDFMEAYLAARAGKEIHQRPASEAQANSYKWLCDQYLHDFEKQVRRGAKSEKTLKARRNLLMRSCEAPGQGGRLFGEMSAKVPATAFERLADNFTPSQADNLMKGVRDMYRFAVKRGIVQTNTAMAYERRHKSQGGAVPWSASDIQKFRQTHPRGSTARLWLTLLVFTGCRIEDATWLGRGQEVRYGDQVWIEYQPRKAGSAPVSLPMLPPLYAATREQKVIGDTYLLSKHGRPYRTPESLRNNVRRWTEAAGLKGRSSHGVRKAFAELLAEWGCTQHQIMAVMSHTQPETSAIYTKGAERRKLAEAAMGALASMDW